MVRNEDGFSTALASAVIFSLCLIAGSLGLLLYSSYKKLNAYEVRNRNIREASEIVNAFHKDIQSLKDEKYDAENSFILRELLHKYSEYSVSMKDISTGINTRFISEKILKNRSIQHILELYDEEITTDFGWINERNADKSFLKEIRDDFEDKKAFPLVNRFPSCNIFFMKPEFIKAVLELYEVNSPEEKVQKLMNVLGQENVSKENISKVIEKSPSDPVFDFLGIKTQFWKIIMETDACHISLVYAAVPEETRQDIVKEYVLVERKITLKGGTEDE